MIPLVGHVNELIATRKLLDAEADAVVAAAGEDIDFKFGTMIEIPRGASGSPTRSPSTPSSSASAPTT